MSGAEKWLFIRKSGDGLYFAFKNFELIGNIPEKFENGAKKLAEFFVATWKKYGQLGQFFDADSGEMVVGNSTAGAIVPAALIKAYEYCIALLRLGGDFGRDNIACAVKIIGHYAIHTLEAILKGLFDAAFTHLIIEGIAL